MHSMVSSQGESCFRFKSEVTSALTERVRHHLSKPPDGKHIKDRIPTSSNKQRIRSPELFRNYLCNSDNLGLVRLMVCSFG